jgi:hypothetical protein
MILVSKGCEQIHPRIRLTQHEGLNVIAGDFETNGVFDCGGVGLMRSLLEHRGETEEFAWPGFIDHNFLMIFVDGRDASPAGNGDIRETHISGFVNALSGCVGLNVDLSGKDGDFVIVEEGEEGHGLEHFWFAAHGVLRCEEEMGSLNADFI